MWQRRCRFRRPSRQEDRANWGNHEQKSAENDKPGAVRSHFDASRSKKSREMLRPLVSTFQGAKSTSS